MCDLPEYVLYDMISTEYSPTHFHLLQSTATLSIQLPYVVIAKKKRDVEVVVRSSDMLL